MDEEKTHLKIDEYELARLYRLDGRVDAVQEYIDREEYPDLDTVLSVLGIDITKMEIRKMKHNKKTSGTGLKGFTK